MLLLPHDQGTPTERGLIEDAVTAYRYVLATLAPRELVLWGHSLGTGVTVGLLVRYHFSYLFCNCGA